MHSATLLEEVISRDLEAANSCRKNGATRIADYNRGNEEKHCRARSGTLNKVN
jgi:hypothetical protein